MWHAGQSSREKPPHVFAIADNAYNAMLAEKRNQVRVRGLALN